MNSSAQDVTVMTSSAHDVTVFLDDSPTLLQIIEERMRELGREDAVIARNIDEAEAMLSRRIVKHIVCDWRMPHGDGIRFLERVQTTWPEVRCSLLTGFIDDIPPDERMVLVQRSIGVFDKQDVDSAWLLMLMSEEPMEQKQVQHTGGGRTTETSGVADKLAELRLRHDQLKRNNANQRRVLEQIAADLVEELNEIESKEKATVIGPNRMLSVNEIIWEIQNLTPEGVRLIELDRAVHRRLQR